MAVAAYTDGVVVLGSKPDELDLPAHTNRKCSAHSRWSNGLPGWLCAAIHWTRGLPAWNAASTGARGWRFGSGLEHLGVRDRFLVYAVTCRLTTGCSGP